MFNSIRICRIPLFDLLELRGHMTGSRLPSPNEQALAIQNPHGESQRNHEPCFDGRLPMGTRRACQYMASFLLRVPHSRHQGTRKGSAALRGQAVSSISLT
jgi:hypothetical protein